MKTVQVNTGKTYEVSIERGMIAQAGPWLAKHTSSRVTALVADDTVDALYGDLVAQSLTDAGFQVARMCFAHGEQNKNLTTYAEVLEFLTANQLTRSDTLVALGGGVTGDLVGFAAATYLRGINVAQIPTTLLAMVDSSVGGKTGVDLPSGKNLVGAFYQPIGVLCDPDVLSTLPSEVFADGMAEAIKYGVLCDEALFELLATGDFASQLETIIERCVVMKATVCQQDECDRGQRQLLNLGHTLGHAIEHCSGYTLPHGHAVAVGMVYAMRIAITMGLCDPACLPRLTRALGNNALPTEAPYPMETLACVARRDKKRAGDTLTFVLPRGIGHCELYPVPIDQLPELAAMAQP